MVQTQNSSGRSGIPDWLQLPSDVNALNPKLWPISATRGGDGEMMLARHRVGELMAQFGSPLYVIDELDFKHRARSFAHQFAGWDVYYAGKAFLCKAVVRWVEQAGLSLDVCSGNELAVALAADFPPDRIEFHGNNKSEEELALAIEAGVGKIVVDSFEEIDRIDRLASQREIVVSVMVRVTTGVTAHTHEYITTAHEDQKFGFSIQSGQAIAALLACHQRSHIDLLGTHSHIGSQIFDTAGFRIAAQRSMELIGDFRTQTGQELHELNLGGGFGIAYTEADAPLGPTALNQELTAIIEATRQKLGLGRFRLAIEPGRAIVGQAGVALYTVGTVKPVDYAPDQRRTYVSVDGGMSDNIRPALYRADYYAALANRSSSRDPQICRVVGKHCESGDILVHDVYLPGDIRPGDVLAVPDSGAYSRSMASNYNHATRPGVVAVNPDQAYFIMRPETLDDLMAMDVG